MDLNVQFTFRNKIFSCKIYIDRSADPCYVFVILNDKEIIKEFGDEVTIKTDCVKLLAKKDDYPKLVELRQAIFDAVKILPEFLVPENKKMTLGLTGTSYRETNILQTK